MVARGSVGAGEGDGAVMDVYFSPMDDEQRNALVRVFEELDIVSNLEYLQNAKEEQFYDLVRAKLRKLLKNPELLPHR